MSLPLALLPLAGSVVTAVHSRQSCCCQVVSVTRLSSGLHMMRIDTVVCISRNICLLQCREDAAKAIDKLDGYGYDNLILRVEWAQPRAER